MRKTRSEQKYLPKINQLTIEPDFEQVSLSRKQMGERSMDPVSIEETHYLSKTKSLKEEILSIPKARQLLNMDKHIYIQDV